MRLLKTIARKLFFPLITGLQADYLLGKLQSNRNLILCFHGVSTNPDFSINNRHMPADSFEKLVSYLNKKYQIVTLEEIFKPASKGSKKRICFTFDDGYLNNYTTALPILEKHNIPATFYIITESLNDPSFVLWADRMDLLVKAAAGNPIMIGEHKFINSGSGYVCKTLDNILLPNYLKKLGREKYDLLLKASGAVTEYEKISNTHTEYTRLMQPDELIRFAQSPLVHIGSHTVWHLNLSNTEEQIVEEELKHSKERLEQLLKKEIQSIAYPDGSYNQKVIELAENCGYTTQLAVVFSEPELNKSDNRIRPRISISNSTTHQSNIFRINLSFGKHGF